MERFNGISMKILRLSFSMPYVLRLLLKTSIKKHFSQGVVFDIFKDLV